MLIILNLPLIGIWIKLLTVPYRFLFPAIMVFCSIGLYTLKQQTPSTCTWAPASRWWATSSTSWGVEPAPLLLGFILGAHDGREPAPRAVAVAR